MPPGSIALVSACVLRMALGGVLSYDASLRTEGRARTRASTTGVLGEAEANPRLGLAWAEEGLELGASYSPRLMVQEQVGGVQVLHGASASGAWQVDPSWRALATAEGRYGRTDLLTSSASAVQNQGQAQPVQPIPRITTVQYLSVRAAVGVEGATSPSQRILARLSAFAEGGADAPARTNLPLQRGGRLEGGFEWTASRSDVLASALDATVSSFGGGVVQAIAIATETWRRALTPSAELRLGAGPTLNIHRERGGETSTLGAGGEVGLHDRWWGNLDGDLSIRAAPVIDQVTANAYERADAVATLSWQPTRRWLLAASGTGGIVLEGPQAEDMIAIGDLRAAWVASSAWELALGLRAISQVPHSSATTSGSEATAYVAVTIRDQDRW